ncbi:MAG: hypothetical protein FJ386_15140, partial [Verrucomicrobia bacterium]|nr:hypothetical protein [Verrucomicrobiota bacterium]
GEFLHWAQKTLLAPAWLALALVATQDRTHPFGVGLHPAFYPMGIYRLLEREVPQQRIFNDMRFGGSMLWWLWPKFPPFIDGRGDTYTPEFWQQQYLPVIQAKPDWRARLEAYDIDAVLLPVLAPGRVPRLATALKADPGWALVAFDENAILFLRRTAANEAVIARTEFRHIWPGDWTLAGITPETAVSSIAEANRTLQLDPKNLLARTVVARAALVTGDYPAAVEMLRALVELPGSGPNYWRDLGYAFMKLGRFDDAEQVFAHMIRKDLARGYAWFMKFHIALQRNARTEADRCLTEALNAEPLNPDYLAARMKFDAAFKK